MDAWEGGSMGGWEHWGWVHEGGRVGRVGA